MHAASCSARWGCAKCMPRTYVYRSGGAVEEWYGSGTEVHLDGIYGGVGGNVVIEDVLVEEPGSFGIWVLGEAWRNVKLVNCTVKNDRDADAFVFADVRELLERSRER